MKLEHKKALSDVLQALGPHGTEPNNAKKYLGFGIKKGDKFRIVVAVGAHGAAFFTEDQNLLTDLATKGIPSKICDQSKPRNKRRYLFPDLTIKQVHDNEDSFRKLVHDSVSMKEQGL